jgi:lipopolysaccharide/colanic/teichoic acid biosynthesis glycosyltransferase/glycosyltransferase involved in cell wall biosynthesis
VRVLHIGKFFPPAKGGMETVLAAICEKTSGHVANRVLVANNIAKTVEERHGSFDVVRVGAFIKIGAVAVCPSMPMHLAHESADLIVIHEPNPMGLLSYFLVRPAGRLIVWFHSEVIRPSWRYRLFYRPFLQFALKRASKIVVASPTLAESAHQLSGWESKCVVIPYGVDVRPDSDAVRRRAHEIREAEAGPMVLFVGRLVPYKGADVLLEAMRGIDAVTFLVGDGPERQTLVAQAEASGRSSRVRFVGEVSDEYLRALYRACDVFVLPSVTRQEAFGIVQIEAMAAGKPVISTDLGTGVTWVNQHGVTGLVVPPRDPKALHDAIAQLLTDSARRGVLGGAAAERARSLFRVDRMIDSTLDLYRSAGDGPEGRPGVAPNRSGIAQSLGKRTLDIGMAGAGLIVSAPLWLILAALIKIGDGGPVFYTQERVGRLGRRFLAWKFRSMIPDAEAGVGAVQSAESDPRVTRIGRLMRATAMDELPQLWNIFRGDMSFVGPRALRPGELEVNGSGAIERLEEVPGFEVRCTVRPGLTGIAQIFAPRDVVRRHKFRYDRFYVRRQSLCLDARLILLSFWITFRGTWEARGRKY